MAIARFRTVVLDCPDPHALAAFYAALLGGAPAHDPAEPDWVDLDVPGGHPLSFQESPGYVAPVWPSDDGAQQFHLDVTVDDLDTAEKEVLALGARVLDNADRDRSWRVYADPVGHPFCLCVD
ncbi:VOC family protein [Streptomyces sp. VRA16 Mangrove soil]|uniref:VOC family protein n=1 Tax=Streptomyces sp. VRA16 Mangrove soil TaxID=2817434 RepID=UPI001A9E00A8|nr:VOC family protein [Streptomyces sp. VRA16 Mangrove soil]MBO1336637.1 VOC family protein [Streptomyces sp. VRA16 Mangrove soil]